MQQPLDAPAHMPLAADAAALSDAAPRDGSLAAPLLLLALWLLATLGIRPLLLPDEGRYADVARAMLAGDPWVPTLNGLPFFHKPPLLYWLDLGAARILGLNEFAVRIGPALGALLMGAAVLFALRRWHGMRDATAALVVLATCPLYFVSAQYVNHDMLVAGLITVAVFALALAVDAPPRVHLGWLLTGWIACALAMLAKGLIGFVLPAWIIVPWLLWQRRWSQMFRLLHPLGLLAAALVAAPWFVAMQARYPGFYDYFFMEQHFRRFAQTSFNNVQPFWFFVAVLPALTLPWSTRLPRALREAWARRDAHTGLYVWWTMAVLFFFSLPSSKIVGYVLPALAPWCVLLASGLGHAGTATRRRLAGACAALCVLAVLLLAWQQPRADRTIARVLAQRIAPGDRVAMVNEYLYDLPYYARLQAPVIVFSDWSGPAVDRQDNWRKELHDAARFDPARAAELLRPLTALPRVHCGSATVWFVAHLRQAPLLAAVPGIENVLAVADTGLWKAAARTCP